MKKRIGPVVILVASALMVSCASARVAQNPAPEIAKSNSADSDAELRKAVAASDHRKAFSIGKQMLSSDPENLSLLLQVVNAGERNTQTGDTSLNAETATYARRAIKLLGPSNAARLPANIDADRVRGNLNFTLGSLLAMSEPAEAAVAFRNATQTNSLRKSPKVYLNLGLATGRLFKKLSDEYSHLPSREISSPRGKAMKAEIDKLGEQTVDAYARAAALSDKPVQRDFRTKMLELLTPIYKTLHNNSEAGLDELVNTVLTKPMP